MTVLLVQSNLRKIHGTRGKIIPDTAAFIKSSMRARGNIFLFNGWSWKKTITVLVHVVFCKPEAKSRMYIIYFRFMDVVVLVVIKSSKASE